MNSPLANDFMKQNSSFDPISFLTSYWLRIILPAIVVPFVIVAQYFVFLKSPAEKIMGDAQRILYFHVGSAISCYLMVIFLLVGSSFYLLTKKDSWDFFCQSSAAVALLFCSIVLLTGMIWGHSAWNTWWRWEPRLVSSLVLWLLLVAYQVLRAFTIENSRAKNFAAILGILVAVNVPIVIFSIRLLSPSEQLHPQVIASDGLKDIYYKLSLLLSTLSLASLAFWLFSVRFSLAALSLRLQKTELNLRNGELAGGTNS